MNESEFFKLVDADIEASCPPPPHLSEEKQLLWLAQRELMTCANQLRLHAGEDDTATHVRALVAESLATIIGEALGR